MYMPRQPWLIVRTEFVKNAEISVEQQIKALGYDAWTPMEVRFHRIQPQDSKFPMPKRHAKRERIWETPLLPTVVFAMPLAGLSVSAQAALAGVRYYRGLHTTNPLYGPAIVTADQITAFRDMVDRENIIRRRQFSRKAEGKRGKKTVTLGDPDGAAILMQELFGLDIPMEDAAWCII